MNFWQPGKKFTILAKISPKAILYESPAPDIEKLSLPLPSFNLGLVALAANNTHS